MEFSPEGQSGLAKAIATDDATDMTIPTLEPSKSYLHRWEVWGVLATVVGLVLTPLLGKMTIKESMFAVAMIIAIAVIAESWRVYRLLKHKNTQLSLELIRAKKRNQDLEIRLAKVTTEFLLIEELPLSSLMIELESRTQRKINNVRVEEFLVRCKWEGAGPVRDAEVTYMMRGINLSDKPLSELLISVDGDNLVPLASLRARYFDLVSDPGRSNPMKPVLRGPDGVSKHLALEFPNPGIAARGQFSVEFSYTWPAIFNSPKNYWFVQTLDFKETDCLVLELDIGTVKNARVQAYSISVSPVDVISVGRIKPDVSSLYVFKKQPPEKNSLYLAVVDGE